MSGLQSFQVSDPMQERVVMLPGAVNLRDFGGYETTDGRVVRRRRLYRSGSLTRLTPAAQRAFLDELRVHTICDLRRPEERAEEPTPFPFDRPRRVEIPIDPGSAIALRSELKQHSVPVEQRIAFMVAINAELARSHQQDYARMFEALLDVDSDDGGFLVHCAAGKDRTGFACALILHALGVAEQTVIEDYLLTNQVLDFEGYILPHLQARLGPDVPIERDELMALAGVRPEYLGAAYRAIEEEFDHVEHYLERAVGLDAAAREILRTRFLA
jgi:protein-tyrosine phosphatase